MTDIFRTVIVVGVLKPLNLEIMFAIKTQNDSFAYNSRSELVAGTLGGNAFNFAFDEIGNQTQFACNATNETTIEGGFVPEYDTDGNATLIKTATGTWSVSYNAENRPARFECAGTQTVVEMNYDYLGRRFEKKITVAGTTTLHHRYVYRGFLQIACLDLTRAGTPALWFVFWDPTQPTATRPLAIQKNGTWFVYGHDLTKNVCEVFGTDGYIKTTYSYSPFGAVSSAGNFEQNFQWSSEFYDPELDLVYYNYRHYSPSLGRWLSRDPIEEHGGFNLYAFCGNNTHNYDVRGTQCCVIIIHPGTYPGENSDVGHAILDCGDNSYVSYFPDKEENKNGIGRWPGKNHSKKEDEIYYGFSFGDFGSGNTIRIPGHTGKITRQCLSSCIDATKAASVIERVRSSTSYWDFNDSNCADMVMNVLREAISQEKPKCKPCYTSWDILAKRAEIQIPEDVSKMVSLLEENDCKRYKCVFDPIGWLFKRG